MTEHQLDKHFSWSDVDPDADLHHLLRFAYAEAERELRRSSLQPVGAPSFHLHSGQLDLVVAVRVMPVLQRRRLVAA